jgi:hydrogenase nickel incorporation protein HypA/HybF
LARLVVHELSVAQGLIELACEAAAKEGADRVTKLSARIGVLSGIVKECLLFSFDLAAEDTPCAGAVLDIDEVALTVMCPQCKTPQTLTDLYRFRCPVCASPTSEILTGRELDLVSVEVSGHAAAHT